MPFPPEDGKSFVNGKALHAAGNGGSGGRSERTTRERRQGEGVVRRRLRSPFLTSRVPEPGERKEGALI